MRDFSVTVTNLANPADAMPVTWSLLAIDIIREVNRIPRATLTFNDGEVASNTFPISDAANGYFNPGQTIRIDIGVAGAPAAAAAAAAPAAEPAAGAPAAAAGEVPAQGPAQAPVEPPPDPLDRRIVRFEGLVMTHAWAADQKNSTLTLSLKDKAVKMTQLRESHIYSQTTDAGIAERLFGKHDLTFDLAGQFPAAAAQDFVQYECTDWDFMLVRAEANGLLVSLKNGAATMKGIALADVPNANFEYGSSEIYSVEMEATADRQFERTSSAAWNISEQNLTHAIDAADPAAQLSPGNLIGPGLARLLSNHEHDLLSPAPLTPQELQGWANAALARSRLALVCGRMSVAGTAAVEVLDTIRISGVGEHFGGAAGGWALVTGVRHRINNTLGWVTDIQFGLADEWFAERPDVAAAAASGLIPPISGLHVGVVDANAVNQANGQLRVRVKSPAFHFHGSVWARVAYPDAGNGRGFYARPQIGDEVVLGFFNGDPRQPVIVGSLYSSSNAPPANLVPGDIYNGKNGWCTVSGLTIVLDEDQRTVLITTGRGNQIQLSDHRSSLCLSDPNGNTITLDGNGITMRSCRDVMVSAPEGNFRVTATNFTA